MRAENLLRKTGKKLWIIVCSEADQEELGLEELMHNRILVIRKPFDPGIMKMAVDQIAEWNAAEQKAPKTSFRRALARFLGKEA